MLARAQVPGSFFGISASGRLLELGWTKLPTLMHLAWAAQYEQYEMDLDEVRYSREQYSRFTRVPDEGRGLGRGSAVGQPVQPGTAAHLMRVQGVVHAF